MNNQSVTITKTGKFIFFYYPLILLSLITGGITTIAICLSKHIKNSK